jgi:hypothetical protein
LPNLILDGLLLFTFAISALYVMCKFLAIHYSRTVLALGALKG